MSPHLPRLCCDYPFPSLPLCLGPLVDEDGGGDSPHSWAAGRVPPAPPICAFLLLSPHPPIPSHSVSGPCSQSAANSCQHVIQQRLRVFVGSPESVKGPIKCTQQLSWSDRLKTGRSPENRQDTQLLGVWPLQMSLGSHRSPRMECSAVIMQPCSVDSETHVTTSIVHCAPSSPSLVPEANPLLAIARSA